LITDDFIANARIPFHSSIMGKTKRLIDELIQKKAQGNSFQELNIQMKLMFKGIDVKKITPEMPDDPATIAKIYEVAQAFQVQLTANPAFART
jgi:hypothetical protein